MASVLLAPPGNLDKTPPKPDSPIAARNSPSSRPVHVRTSAKYYSHSTGQERNILSAENPTIVSQDLRAHRLGA